MCKFVCAADIWPVFNLTPITIQHLSGSTKATASFLLSSSSKLLSLCWQTVFSMKFQIMKSSGVKSEDLWSQLMCLLLLSQIFKNCRISVYWKCYQQEAVVLCSIVASPDKWCPWLCARQRKMDMACNHSIWHNISCTFSLELPNLCPKYAWWYALTRIQ